ncbi:MAG: GyrI-like domain-containing protein [Halobacteriota archaeon]
MVNIEAKTADEIRAACIFHNGSPSTIGENMRRLLGQLIGWVQQEGLQMTGPPFAVYYSTPEDMAQGHMQFEVGVPISGAAQGTEYITIKPFPAQNVLSAIHKGPYNQIGPVYAALMEYVQNNKYEVIGPPMELWLNNPMEVAENELLTEVRFPVAKK